jgi:predicted nucleotidyltransferase
MYKSGVVRRLADKGLIKPPGFVTGSVHYETIMGSMAYGVSSDSSDMDIYGFCIPPKEIVFPHTAGYIPNFSSQVPNFDQFTQHHVQEKDHGKEYDLSIYNIVRYFKLCMGNNPNRID